MWVAEWYFQNDHSHIKFAHRKSWTYIEIKQLSKMAGRRVTILQGLFVTLRI